MTSGPGSHCAAAAADRTPAEFLEVGGDANGAVAILCDHMRRMIPEEPPEGNHKALERARGAPAALMGLTPIVCWLLHDDWFLGRPKLAAAMWKLFAGEELSRLAVHVRPEKCVNDPDRREELVRICLRGLALRPKGETDAQAADRLTTLDSAERDRVLRATAAAEKRAREVREEMAAARARDAASRYSE